MRIKNQSQNDHEDTTCSVGLVGSVGVSKMTEQDTEYQKSAFAGGIPDECPYCNEQLAHPSELDEAINKTTIWRRHRQVHYSWANVPEELEGKYLSGDQGEQGTLPEEAKMDTQMFEVTFHDEHRERAVVEAANSSEAKDIAELERTYNGEFVHTIHTDRRELSEPSQASKDYLNKYNLLPEEWDGDLDD